MHYYCTPDHGYAILWSCIGAIVGLLVGKLLSDAEHRRKPPS